MGPKQRKKDVLPVMNTEGEKIKDASQRPSVDVGYAITDPLYDLRYTPQVPCMQTVIPEQRAKTILVLKKRRLPTMPAATQTRGDSDVVVEVKSDVSGRGYSSFYLGQKYNETPSPNVLSIYAIESKPLSKWFSPGELPLTPPPLAVLKRQAKETSDLVLQLETSYRMEKSNLERYDEEKERELDMENCLMKRTGKEREKLLMRRQQNLPHLQQKGLENALIKIERTETPEIIYDTDIFCEAAALIREKNGIRRTLTRREKGYNVITDWVGYPEVTDVITRKLGIRRRTIPRGVTPLQIQPVGEFIPKCEELGVIGLGYELAQQQLRGITSMKSVDLQRGGIFFSDASKPKYDGGKVISHAFSKQEEGSGPAEPSVGLAIGQIKLFWSRDPERSNKKWVVELGCSAEIGRNSVASITMTNIGIAVVRFKWSKVPPTNTFNLKKYDLRRFVFDCWGGVILPGETFRIPVLYKCMEPGFYSEDWRLITEPVMENGAEVIIRLWGITRKYDPYRPVRQKIDENLKVNMTRTLVEHRVKKIVDYLPLREVPLKDTRFPLVHLGPDLFHLNNPWLKYHCASVYRLGKLAAMTEIKRESQVRETPFEIKSKTSTLFSEVDQSTSDLHVQFRSSSAISDHRIYDTENMGEEEGESMKMIETFSDTVSPISDEEVAPSISRLKRQIEEHISPDNPILIFPAQGLDEDDEYDDMLIAKRAPMSINLTNPDFVVDQIRQNILDNVTDSREQKEAEFLILSEQVARLLFRTDKPIDDWKMIVGRSLLCSVIDSFSEFAAELKVKCCEAEMIQLMFESTLTHSMSTTESSEDEVLLSRNDPSESFSESQDDESHSQSQTSLMCIDRHPRYAFQFLRFQDEFYNRIYCRMYDLLCHFLDTLEALLSEATVLKLSQDQVGFTRVRNIPMNFGVEEMLSAPLPPKWVKLAQRMDNIVIRNRARKEFLDDLQ